MMRDFYFHGNINTRNKQAYDDEWEMDEESDGKKLLDCNDIKVCVYYQ